MKEREALSLWGYEDWRLSILVKRLAVRGDFSCIDGVIKRKKNRLLVIVVTLSIIGVAYFLTDKSERADFLNQIFFNEKSTTPAKSSKKTYTERTYQDAFAKTLKGSRTEVVASNGTRCDILTNEYAIEVDFAKKWQEAVGQSLNYSVEFNKKAGILLILESEKDKVFLDRLTTLVAEKNLQITIWTITPAEIKE